MPLLSVLFTAPDTRVAICYCCLRGKFIMCLRTTLALRAQLQLPEPVCAQLPYKPMQHTVFIVPHEGKGMGKEAGHGNCSFPFEGFTRDRCSSATCISESHPPEQPMTPSPTASTTETATISSHTLPSGDYKLNQTFSFYLFCSPPSEEHQKKGVICRCLNPLAFWLLLSLE